MKKNKYQKYDAPLPSFPENRYDGVTGIICNVKKKKNAKSILL